MVTEEEEEEKKNTSKRLKHQKDPDKVWDDSLWSDYTLTEPVWWKSKTIHSSQHNPAVKCGGGIIVL